MPKKPDKDILKARKRSKSAFPPHLGGTPEEWRALKRQEWKEVEHAFNRFAYGSAYVPSQADFYKLYRMMAQMTEALEQPDWVAW